MARRKVAQDGWLVLDSEGLSKAAEGSFRVWAYLDVAYSRSSHVAVSALTLAEVLRGSRRDAAVHRILSKLVVFPVTAGLARRAGELLGRTGLDGHRCAIDAVVAATALSLPAPVVVLTSDPDDMGRLVDDPQRPKEITVVHV